MARIRILVVEDEHLLNAALVRALADEAYAVTGVETAGEAVARSDFDVAILDVNLRDGSGLTVLRAWRERGIDAPVIMLTGDRRAATIDGAMRGLDAWDYLAKPFDLPTLLASIADVLRRVRERAEGGDDELRAV